MMNARKLAALTTMLVLSQPAFAVNYHNPLMGVGDYHNACLEQIGEPHGGWALLATWGPISEAELRDATIDCVTAIGADAGAAMSMLTDPQLVAGDAQMLSDRIQQTPELGIALAELDSKLFLHGQMIEQGLPRGEVLDALAASYEESDAFAEATLSDDALVIYYSAAATGIRSFEFWTEPAVAAALVATRSSTQSCGGVGKTIYDASREDMRGAGEGAAAGGAILGGLGLFAGALIGGPPGAALLGSVMGGAAAVEWGLVWGAYSSAGNAIFGKTEKVPGEVPDFCGTDDWPFG